MPYGLCPMPYALCPMPYALCPMHVGYLMLLRKAISAASPSSRLTASIGLFPSEALCLKLPLPSTQLHSAESSIQNAEN